MKSINVCITVFNRYDLLANLITSIRNSVLSPGRDVRTLIIDRGNSAEGITTALNGHTAMVVNLPGQSLPGAWNWFIENVPEERILTSDDIEFFPEALEAFATTSGPFVGLADGKSSAYACFSLRDECREKVGLFDETISPDYMYFEDCDYARRMVLLGVPVVGLNCMHHGLAQSWVKKSLSQQMDHHRRFILAQENYLKKWGGLPSQETFTQPYNGLVLA